MYKIVLYAVSVLLLAACSSKTPPAPSQKVFDAEDVYILYALRAEEVGRFDTAAKLFSQLYEKANKREYLYRELQDLMAAKRFESVVKKVDTLLEEEDKTDPQLLRFKVLALLHLKKYKAARDAGVELVKISKKSEDYLLVAESYVKLKKYNMAVKYLEGAYSKNYDEKILDKISIILYMNLQKRKEAIAQLETHSRMFGCSKLICNRLLSFYSNLNDVDGMLSVYKRYYKIDPSDEVATKIIQLYVYKKDYSGLRKFLEKHRIDDDVLLQLYVNARDYKKAYRLAYKLYKQTHNLDYLGQGAIYEYESYKKPSKKILKKIVKRLKKVVRKKPSGLYLNYLGYLLIDHDIDVKEGMGYIRKALKYHPNSAYYLDSLAWGYYKLHKCKKADRLFKRIRKLEGGNDKEVVKHHKKVKECLKKQALAKKKRLEKQRKTKKKHSRKKQKKKNNTTKSKQKKGTR